MYNGIYASDSADLHLNWLCDFREVGESVTLEGGLGLGLGRGGEDVIVSGNQ